MGTQGLDVSLKGHEGTSLIVQWFRLHVPNVGCPGLLLGQGTRFPHAAAKTWCSQVNYRKKRAKGDGIAAIWENTECNVHTVV